MMASTLREDTRIQLAAFDKQEHPVLAVEVKAMAGASDIGLPWFMSLASEFCSIGYPIPYWMFVDLDEILISRREAGESSSLSVSIKTSEVLCVYEPDFERKRIFDDYLLALVERWLQDFAFDWRSNNPPAMTTLTEIGLAERLKGGITYREVSLADLSPLRGNQLRDEPFPGPSPGDR